MPKIDDESLTEEQFEARLLVSYFSGRATAYEESAGRLRKLAGEAFAHRNDASAKIYRDLAEDFVLFGQKEREKQQEEETQTSPKPAGAKKASR